MPGGDGTGPAQGAGGGGGRGMGRGGGGRGRGGGGRGMGRGGGRRGRGGPGQQAFEATPGPARQTNPPSGSSGTGSELAPPKTQGGAIRPQGKRAGPGTDRMAPSGPAVIAKVDEEECGLCGACVEVCPTGAVAMDEVVTINADECTGCGVCVEQCPNQAISLTV